MALMTLYLALGPERLDLGQIAGGAGQCALDLAYLARIGLVLDGLLLGLDPDEARAEAVGGKGRMIVDECAGALGFGRGELVENVRFELERTVLKLVYPFKK